MSNPLCAYIASLYFDIATLSMKNQINRPSTILWHRRKET
jgi:hypothetical protein